MAWMSASVEQGQVPVTIASDMGALMTAPAPDLPCTGVQLGPGDVGTDAE